MWRVVPIIFAAWCGIARCQPPALLQNGVFNSAGRLPASLPGGAIAPGARFTVLGVRLGDSSGTTRVEIRAGGRTYAAQLVAVTPRSIEAILPAAAKPGAGELTVARDGEISRPAPIRIGYVPGLYSSNGLGWGPGLFSGIPKGGSAAPGDRVSLAVTGWTRASELFAGGRKVSSVAVTPSKGGGQQVSFRIPRNIGEGCSVPVLARSSAGLVSNVVTLPVRSTRASCADPLGVPPPTARTGIVLLSHLSMLLEMQPGDPRLGVEENGEAVFAANEKTPIVLPLHIVPPPGSCAGLAANYQAGQGVAGLLEWALNASGTRGLEAGPGIRVHGAEGDKVLNGWGGGVYSARLAAKPTRSGTAPADFFAPGRYVVSSDGGAGAGAFEAALDVAPPLTWTNRESTTTVDRSAGVTLAWTGADAARPVLVAAISIDRLSTASYASFCTAAAGETTFHIPSDALANLPATRIEAGPPMSLLLVMQAAAGAQAPLHARGIDNGAAIYVTGSGRSVVYR